MKNPWLVAGTCLALVLPAHSGAAFAPPILRESAVHHGDIDLGTPAGADMMLDRLDEAASEACGGHPGPLMGDLHFANAIRREYQRCRIAAIDAATLRLGAPAVREAWLRRPEAEQGAQARQRSAELLRLTIERKASSPDRARGEHPRSDGQ